MLRKALVLAAFAVGPAHAAEIDLRAPADPSVRPLAVGYALVVSIVPPAESGNASAPADLPSAGGCPKPEDDPAAKRERTSMRSGERELAPANTRGRTQRSPPV